MDSARIRCSRCLSSDIRDRFISPAAISSAAGETIFPSVPVPMLPMLGLASASLAPAVNGVVGRVSSSRLGDSLGDGGVLVMSLCTPTPVSTVPAVLVPAVLALVLVVVDSSGGVVAWCRDESWLSLVADAAGESCWPAVHTVTVRASLFTGVVASASVLASTGVVVLGDAWRVAVLSTLALSATCVSAVVVVVADGGVGGGVSGAVVVVAVVVITDGGVGGGVSGAVSVADGGGLGPLGSVAVNDFPAVSVGWDTSACCNPLRLAACVLLFSSA